MNARKEYSVKLDISADVAPFYIDALENERLRLWEEDKKWESSKLNLELTHLYSAIRIAKEKQAKWDKDNLSVE